MITSRHMAVIYCPVIIIFFIYEYELSYSYIRQQYVDIIFVIFSILFSQHFTIFYINE